MKRNAPSARQGAKIAKEDREEEVGISILLRPPWRTLRLCAK
jgi:hypothetical protein